MNSQSADEHQRSIYQQLLADVALEEDNDSEVIFTGPADPISNSPYYLGEGFAALAGAVGMANAIIWRMRGGNSQKITIDRQKSLYHLYRMQFLRQNGYRVLLSAPFKHTGRTHRCKDGRFIEILTTFRHLEDGMLELLGCLNTKEAVDAAFLNWNSYELEEEINKRGLCGAVIRSKQEWHEHPQGKALLGIPVITIEKIADSEPIPFKPAKRPLSGVRILDLAHIVAGPTMGNVLAEQGADVLHINPPNREQILTNIMDTGWGKLSAYLDLGDKTDVSRLNDLIKDNCDVFIQSYRPGALGTLAALIRRAHEGGSYHVNVSLARGAMWYQDIGYVSQEKRKKLIRPFQEDMQRCLDPRIGDGFNDHVELIETDTPFGRLTHMAPLTKYSETPGYWERPTVPLGYHHAEWPSV